MKKILIHNTAEKKKDTDLKPKGMVISTGLMITSGHQTPDKIRSDTVSLQRPRRE